MPSLTWRASALGAGMAASATDALTAARQTLLASLRTLAPVAVWTPPAASLPPSLPAMPPQLTGVTDTLRYITGQYIHFVHELLYDLAGRMDTCQKRLVAREEREWRRFWQSIRKKLPRQYTWEDVADACCSLWYDSDIALSAFHRVIETHADIPQEQRRMAWHKLEQETRPRRIWEAIWRYLPQGEAIGSAQPTLREMATAVDGFRAKYPTVSEDDLRVSLMREAGYSEAECDILLGIAPEETCAQAVSAAPRPF